MFALVDCNNFYASCERLFRPDLNHQPIIVLSNNDGCVVARSKEAKALGIKMAVPVFQIQDIILHHQVQVFSSNYALYADISQRVMQILEEQVPRIEIYSIDEAFLDMTGFQQHQALFDRGRQIKQKIYQWVGIPVCVGIAPTKTLAKLANYAAKKYPATQGVVDLSQTTRQQKLMARTPVAEVWGVGRRIAARLNQHQIYTALELSRQDHTWIRRHFSIVLARTIQELNGVPCFDLEESPSRKKQIVCSRSFGRKVTERTEIEQALCTYAARAAKKLRAQKQQAKTITLFIRTSAFQDQQHPYQRSLSKHFVIPTNDTRDMMAQIKQLIPRLWQPGYAYAKAGVMLSDFYDEGTYQLDLWTPENLRPQSKALMQVIDKINQTGLGHIQFAAQGIERSWHMQRNKQSPAYTTRWSDLPRVT